MTALRWDRPIDRTYQTGVDRGVIYPENESPAVWVGLSNVKENGDSTVKEYFLDGQKYLSYIAGKNWSGTVEAYTFPDEMYAVIGMPEVGDGLYVDSQIPKPFGLSYRTMIAAPEYDEKPHYKIHIIYNALTSSDDITYATSSNVSEPTAFSFAISATPQKITGYRATAHVVIDTRKIDDITRAEIENLLYGTDSQDAKLPAIQDLVDMLSFGDTVEVVYNGDGTWTARGANKFFKTLKPGYFQIDNIDAIYTSPTEYEIQNIPEMFGMDSDGTVFAKMMIGPDSNADYDSDSTPIYLHGSNDANVREDDDGAIYVEPNED